MRRWGGVCLLLALGVLPAGRAAAEEPASATVGWSAPDSFREVDFPLTLERDPGEEPAAWLSAFSFVGSDLPSRGTFGMTTGPDGTGSFEVSVTGATGSDSGRGAVCSTDEPTSTETCRYTERPVVGHVYTFTAERQVTSAWVFSVRDDTADSQIVLGAIAVGGSRDMTAAGWSGTRQGDCAAVPASQALFGSPVTSAGTAAFSSSSSRTSCPGSKVEVTADGARVVTGPAPTAAPTTPPPLALPTSAPQPTAPVTSPAAVRTQDAQPVTASRPPAALASRTPPSVALPRAEASVKGTSSSGPTPVAAPESASGSGRNLPWWLPLLLLPIVLVPVKRRSGHA